MEKPIKHTYEYYDYHECEKFVEEKYKITVRDFAGKFSGEVDHNEVPYQDFWHFVLGRATTITNGSVFMMCEWWGDGAEVWQVQILNMFLDEFGELSPGSDPHERSITFFVGW